jgi:N-acetylglutamate synthase-like GNAT family acetyltransferase
MTIRDASDSDIPTLVEMIRSSFKEVAARWGLNEKDHPRSTSFYTVQRMKDDFAKGIHYYILEDDSKAIGCVAMESADKDICYLMRLAVLPDYRKRNLGEKLVRHLLAQAAQTGAKRVQIGIVDTADRLKQWYESLGFVQFKTQTFEHLPFVVAFLSVNI